MTIAVLSYLLAGAALGLAAVVSALCYCEDIAPVEAVLYTGMTVVLWPLALIGVLLLWAYSAYEDRRYRQELSR